MSDNNYTEKSPDEIKERCGAFPSGYGTCGKPTCCTPPLDVLTLSGSEERTETEIDINYCWTLIVDNETNKCLACATLLLDIRSFQTNAAFSVGPGVFASASYTITPPDGLVGTVNALYAGTGTFYTTHNLPPGESLFTVCATFTKPAPILDFTTLLPAVFTVKGLQNGPCSNVLTVNETVSIDPST